MTTPRHTPGPWRLGESKQMGNRVEGQSGRPLYEGDDGWRTVASYQDCCASTDYDETDANAAANGRLIAAAPDLLTACKEALAKMEYALAIRAKATGIATGGNAGTVAALKAAIAKAEGGAS